MSLLTTKSKYHGAVNEGIEVIWIQNSLGVLIFLVEDSTIIIFDNPSVIKVTKKPIVHNKMNDVELHVQYLRLVEDNVVKLVYCRTYD